MAASELREFQAFEAHPQSRFQVGVLYTRRSPYPSFQVLSRALLKKSSDSLRDSTYYARFSPEMLRAVGMPRD
jgi:transposase